MLIFVDPEKMIAARNAGASAWELRERAIANEFAPAQPYDLRPLFWAASDVNHERQGVNTGRRRNNATSKVEN